MIGIQHTYGAVITVFNDGTVAKNNPSALPDGAPTEEYETAAHILSDQWAGDMGFTLDFMQLQNDDPSSPFHALLDLDARWRIRTFHRRRRGDPILWHRHAL